MESSRKTVKHQQDDELFFRFDFCVCFYMQLPFQELEAQRYLASLAPHTIGLTIGNKADNSETMHDKQ